MKRGGPVVGNRKPQPQAWIAYPIGRTGFSLNAVMIRPKNQVRAVLYLSGAQAKTFFRLLRQQQEVVERDLGDALEWEELPTKRDCRVAAYLNDVDPEDQSDWPRQHKWLARQLNDMHRVFASRIKALDSDTEPNVSV